MNAPFIAERPIALSGPLSGAVVRALLRGEVVQQRRLLRPQPERVGEGWRWSPPRRRASSASDAACSPGSPVTWEMQAPCPAALLACCPWGVPGARLFVQEPLKRGYMRNLFTGEPMENVPVICYAADGASVLTKPGEFDLAWTWKRALLPGMHMPRFAARLKVEVVSVRVERLQWISACDCEAEGVEIPPVDYRVADDPRVLDHEREMALREKYKAIWARTHGVVSWTSDPLVWVLTLRPVGEAFSG